MEIPPSAARWRCRFDLSPSRVLLQKFCLEGQRTLKDSLLSYEEKAIFNFFADIKLLNYNPRLPNSRKDYDHVGRSPRCVVLSSGFHFFWWKTNFAIMSTSILDISLCIS